MCLKVSTNTLVIQMHSYLFLMLYTDVIFNPEIFLIILVFLNISI